jgi:hypothetical protein
MDKNKPPAKPLPQPVPQGMKDFFNLVSPARSPSPVDDLQGRYLDKVNEAKRGSATFSNARDIDAIVEFRIREWMMRVEKEAQEERKRKELLERLNRPHDPPKPGAPNNKITPPKN